MTKRSIDLWEQAIRERGTEPQRSPNRKNGFRSPCPAHGGTGFNLDVWQSGDRVRAKCHSKGCSFRDIKRAVFGDSHSRIPAPTREYGNGSAQGDDGDPSRDRSAGVRRRQEKRRERYGTIGDGDPNKAASAEARRKDAAVQRERSDYDRKSTDSPDVAPNPRIPPFPFRDGNAGTGTGAGTTPRQEGEESPVESSPVRETPAERRARIRANRDAESESTETRLEIPDWWEDAKKLRNVERYSYFGTNGRLAVVACRGFDRRTGKKRVWRDPSGVEGPFQPYRSESLGMAHSPRDPVLVVEGEKAADAAAGIFKDDPVFVTTSIGGANQAANTDWSLTRGRRVTIWPDHDDEGQGYAADVSRLVREAGAAEVRIVRVPESFPEKWDLADEVPDGFDLLTLYRAAELVRAPEEPDDFEGIWNGALLQLPEPEYEWLVDELLPVGGTSLVSGGPKVGKSTLMRCLSLSVCTGGEWLGRQCRAGTVLYFGLEEIRNEVRKHMRMLGGPESIPLRHYFLAPRDDRLDWIAGEIAEHNPVLVVVDTLGVVLDIGDGHSYFEVYPAMQPYRVLARETGAHIAFVHHNRKSGGDRGEEAMGSQGIVGSVDTFIGLHWKDDDRRSIYSMNRYGDKLPKSILRYDDATGLLSIGETTASADASDMERQILTFVRDHSHQPVGLQSVKDGVTGRTHRIVRALNSLVEAGRLLMERTYSESGRERKSYRVAEGVFAAAVR